MSLLLWLLALAAIAYFGLCLLLFLRQRELLYRPGEEPPDLARLAEVGAFRLIETTSADGLRLRHLWLPPSGDPATPASRVVVAFHGNAGTAAERAGKLAATLAPGQGLLLAEYRGFAGNPGSPSEAGLIADGIGVLAWLETQGIGPERWVVYGESLGSGVATQLAARQAAAGRPVAGLVLEAPYTSIARAAQHHYWYVPARWLVRDRFDSLSRIGRVGAPLLILHGKQDRVVPYEMGRRLLAAAAEPKCLLSIEQGAHADLYDFPEVPATVARFLAAPEAAARHAAFA